MWCPRLSPSSRLSSWTACGDGCAAQEIASQPGHGQGMGSSEPRAGRPPPTSAHKRPKPPPPIVDNSTAPAPDEEDKCMACPSGRLHPTHPWRPEWLQDKDRPEVSTTFFEIGGKVFCRECIKGKVEGIFTKGKLVSDRWEKRQLTQHLTLSEKHREAKRHNEEAVTQATNLQTGRQNALAKVAAHVVVMLQLVYWLSCEAIALAKLTSLYQLVCSLQGIAMPHQYANSARAREFLLALATVLRGQLWEDILLSPFVSVMIDESTDVSTSENMIIYMVYIKDGRAQVTYVALVHCPDVDAAAITASVVDYLVAAGLPLTRVVCFCSDGASVMTGHISGVATRLQELNPFMLAVHCIAHRLALCCADSAADLDYPEMAEATVNQISSFFNRSGKRVVALKKLAHEFRIGRTKIVKSGTTRWLSRAGCVQVLLMLFPVLARLFAELAGDDDVAAALLVAIHGYTFVGCLAAMNDLLQMLALLSQTFQRDIIDYGTVRERLQAVRRALVRGFLPQKRDSELPRFNPDDNKEQWDKVWNRVLEHGIGSLERPTAPTIKEFFADSATFRGVRLDDAKLEELHKWVVQFALAVLSRLGERFPKDDMEVLDALEVLNPGRLSDEDEYGLDALAVLSRHYGTAKTAESGTVAPMIDGAALELEWHVFREHLAEHKRLGLDAASSAARFLQAESAPANITILLQIKTVLALNTAMCERGFSRMKLVKSALRNRLYIETLDALMLLGLVGPCYVTDETKEWFFQSAYAEWSSMSQRNPNKARWGNQSAKKKRAREIWTEIPAEQSEHDDGLDEKADAEEEAEEADAEEEGASTLALVPPYRAETGYIIQVQPASLDAIKGQKVAYKFEDGWLQGTCKGIYKGRKDEYKGLYAVYFDRRTSFYLNINLNNYGCDQDWVIIKKA